MKVPAHYAKAPKLSTDGLAALAGSRLVWDRLEPRMQAALREGWTEDGDRIVANGIRLPTREALVDRGLVVCNMYDSPLTHLGALVREAGTRMTAEVDDAA
jgi:hypothetical protein